MFCKAGFTLFFFAIATTAYAQTPDGVYKGSVLITRLDAVGPNPQLTCQVGKAQPIEFRVSAGTLTLTSYRAQRSFSGPVAADGSFRVSGYFSPAGVRTKVQQQEWTGMVKGSRVTGNYIGSGPNGTCFGTISARK
jgi:hypothetical protein